MIRIVGIAAALSLMAPAAAPAEKVIRAETMWRFDAMSYAIDQGETLLFQNVDAASPGPHNVTSEDAGPDGKPLFRSATVAHGETVPVDGAPRLKTGSYGFICSVHPFMTAALVVSDRGTPVGDAPPPPPPASAPAPAPAAADTRAPSLQVALARASLRAKRFSASVTADEPAELLARLTLRSGRRTITVGRATARATSAGTPVRLSFRSRRAIRKLRRGTLTIAVEARDAAGNVGKARAKRTVRR